MDAISNGADVCVVRFKPVLIPSFAAWIIALSAATSIQSTPAAVYISHKFRMEGASCELAPQISLNHVPL